MNGWRNPKNADGQVEICVQILLAVTPYLVRYKEERELQMINTYIYKIKSLPLTERRHQEYSLDPFGPSEMRMKTWCLTT